MIYMDNAATTKMDEDILPIMVKYMTEKYYNPSSIYYQGKEIKAEIEAARKTVSALLGCCKDEIVFTGSGTESDNLAIKGVAFALKQRGQKHLITTEIEHHAVLNSFKWLEKHGFKVTYLPVNQKFQISTEDFKKAIRKDTGLVSVMYANNEVGALQPIREIAKIAGFYKIVTHCDAVQGIGTEAINVKKLGVDMLSVSGHKIYGPKGIGALYIKKETPYQSLISGGQQEKYRRSGTENASQIIGFSKACEKLIHERDTRKNYIKAIKEHFIQNLIGEPLIKINAAENSVASIASISLKDMFAEPILIMLAHKQILAAMGAACNTGELEPSHVLKAGKLGEAYINGTMRFSFGKHNTIEETVIVANEIKNCVDKLKKF